MSDKQNKETESNQPATEVQEDKTDEAPERIEAQEASGLTNPEVDHLVKERKIEDDKVEPFEMDPIEDLVFSHATLVYDSLGIVINGHEKNFTFYAGESLEELQERGKKFFETLHVPF